MAQAVASRAEAVHAPTTADMDVENDPPNDIMGAHSDAVQSDTAPRGILVFKHHRSIKAEVDRLSVAVSLQINELDELINVGAMTVDHFNSSRCHQWILNRYPRGSQSHPSKTEPSLSLMTEIHPVSESSVSITLHGCCPSIELHISTI